MTGLTIGIIGLALTALLCGIASGLGLKATGKAAAGVLAEDPSKFSKVLILTLLPATQGLYGFIITLIGASNLPTVANLQAAGILETATAAQINAQGWLVFFVCVPTMIGGAVSAYLQGRTSAATIIAVGKKSEVSRAFLFPAMIELYALLGMVASIIMFGNIPVANVANITLPVAEEVKEVAGEAARIISTLIGA